MKPRQAAILRALGHLPEPTLPPRDEAGQFTAEKPVPSFDGGARETPPLAVTPEQAQRDHGALVVELLATRHLQRSAAGWSVRE